MVEPFGENVEWLRHGIRTSLLANINRKKGAAPFKPEDFMPDQRRHDPSTGKAEATRKLKAILLPLADSLRKRGKVKTRSRDGR